MLEDATSARAPSPVPTAVEHTREREGRIKEIASSTNLKEQPFSIYSLQEKWAIVSMTSFAAVFSPLTANIYFPAIPKLTTEFHKSTELINLTVTVYMIMQGLAPMAWGTLSDRWGRRPMFIACMVLLSLSCVGLALVPTSDYWLLLLLRGFQAAGSASTVALGAGVIGDISTPAERGGFMGIFSIGPMVGPSIGPVIGGILSQSLGWRSIFWFMCICSGICALAIALFLPETLRSIVGNGSIRPLRVYLPLVPIIGRHRGAPTDTTRPPRKPFTNPLRIFTYPDVVVLLVFNGVIYAVYYGVTASISSLFKKAYPYLNQTTTGLCFLAIGGGMLIGTLLSGKLMDRDYAAIRDAMIKKAQADSEGQIIDVNEITKSDNFPIEKARLRTAPIHLALFIGCVLGYGWALQAKVNLAVPLILQMIMGLTVVSIMNIITTLLVDLMPSQGSSITACNNMVRCLLGAGLVSVIDIIIKALGAGWTYIVLGGGCILVSPLLIVVLRWGPVWREQRRVSTAAANPDKAKAKEEKTDIN
ncbi:MFS general substrate transporter [Auriscalpium vulgare]|uniref:MFS general substrate transporter n=1 Tax=Auriscalpium vulgare TaxID=40419 RepID=A0ACB8S8Q9_9AGAM|nr:MFS general substrate transporter [Auriscalpium vulgare]